MQARVFGIRHDGKVPEDVVRLEIVDVVDDLAPLQWTPQDLLGDYASLLAVVASTVAASVVYHAVAVLGLRDAASPCRVHRAALRLHASAALDESALKVGTRSDGLATAVAAAAPMEVLVPVARASYDDKPAEAPPFKDCEVVLKSRRALEARLALKAASSRILRVSPVASREALAAHRAHKFVCSVLHCQFP